MLCVEFNIAVPSEPIQLHSVHLTWHDLKKILITNWHFILTICVVLRFHIYIVQCQQLRNYTVYPLKYAHGLWFAVLCCGYTLTGFPISIRLTSLALWQSNDCPSASKATMMNMDKYFTWIHYERLHNHNKAKRNKTVCTFLGIYCNCQSIDWPITTDLATNISTFWQCVLCRVIPLVYNCQRTHHRIN